MKKIIFADNTLEPESWEIVEVEDVCAYLATRWEKWPASARIYHRQIAQVCDVTPHDEASVAKLQALDGPFYVMVYPGEFATIAFVATVISIILTVASFLMPVAKPKIPQVAQRNSQTTSPNNDLSERKNTPRPGGRIPDIFGTVRSTPDLIAVPYSLYINHTEVEYAYMCIGRGSYAVSDIRDDTTAIGAIFGSAVEVYGPFTSPNSGTPQLTIGSAITEPLWSATRSNAVNGQVLRAPNSANIVGSSNIRFVAPNIIETNSSTLSFSDVFADGESVVITNAVSAPDSVDLAGTYTIDTVSGSSMTLVNPASVNSDWNVLDAGDDYTDYISPTLQSVGDKWVGPFDLTVDGITQVMVNFVALNGLYKDDGTNQVRFDVTLELELTPIDSVGVPTGAATTSQVTIEGSALTTSTRAATLRTTTVAPGRYRCRARRVTNADLTYAGTVVDEIKWRDLFAMVPVSKTDFGDVTTVQSVTYGTAGALSIKERKLNMLVTRELPQRISGSTFTAGLVATNSAADIIAAMCLDPYIGNRSTSEVDFDSIYDTIAEVIDYFGTNSVGEFNYTFDNNNISFEETVASVADAVFSLAYRRGSQIKLYFEKETDVSTLIFNHRNKVPGSETRNVSFGKQNDNDGVFYEYVDPEDDAIVTLYVPDQTAINPKRVESVGVRGKLQAYFHAMRLWNKIRYQRIVTEFEALKEAELLVLQDRILVADNTRPNTQDGQVESQDGLVLTLSQNVVFDAAQTYIISLQHVDGTTENIGITAGINTNQVILDTAPRAPLSLDSANYAKATYVIVGSANTREQAFLVTERTPQSNFTVNVRAVNYDARYYQNDMDFVNNVVDSDGELL